MLFSEDINSLGNSMKNNLILIFTLTLLFIGQLSAQTQLLMPGLKSNDISKVKVTTSEAANSQLSTPRSSMSLFLMALEKIKAGDDKAYAEAVEVLDLSFMDKAMRKSVGKVTVDRLMITLSKLGGVTLKAVPEYTEGSRWFLRKQTVQVEDKIFEVEISIDRNSLGEWKITKETIQSIEIFEESLKGIKLTNGDVPFTWKEKIKGSMPGWMGKEVFIMKNGQWIGLGLVLALGLLFFIFVRYILSRYLRKIWFKDHVEQTKEEESDSTLPFGILVFALNWIFCLQFLELHLDVFSYLMRAGYIMTAISTVWVGLKIVDLLGIHFEKVAEESDNKFDDVLVPMLRKAAKVFVVAFGAVFVAHSLTFDVGSILAGLGIGGVAVALAAKDTISNLFGSITVLLDRPFQIGDHIVLEKGIEGIVEEVGFRSTRIRTPYNSLISMPNAVLANIHVDNYGARRMRRFRATLGVIYDTKPEKIEEFCERLRYLIKLNPAIRQDNFQVSVTELGASSINILLNIFFDTIDPKVEAEEKHKFILEILTMASEIGVEFAFPTQTLLMKNTNDLK